MRNQQAQAHVVPIDAAKLRDIVDEFARLFRKLGRLLDESVAKVPRTRVAPLAPAMPPSIPIRTSAAAPSIPASKAFPASPTSSAHYIEPTWIELKEAAPFFGMSFESAKNAVHLGRFPCPTYKLGRRRVIDKTVMKEFFARKNSEGMTRLDDPGFAAKASPRVVPVLGQVRRPRGRPRKQRD